MTWIMLPYGAPDFVPHQCEWNEEGTKRRYLLS
jgi:hypothetical protein